MIVYCQFFSYWQLRDSFSPMHWEYELILLISSSGYAALLALMTSLHALLSVLLIFRRNVCFWAGRVILQGWILTTPQCISSQRLLPWRLLSLRWIRADSQLPQKGCNLSEQPSSLQVLIFLLWEEIFCSICFTQNLCQGDFFKQHLEMLPKCWTV